MAIAAANGDQTKIRGGIGFLYLLFEHQSVPDHWMIFRLLSYMVNIWKEFLDQHPGTKRLPVIFPAVLYNGKREWRAAKHLKDLMRGNEDFLPHIPNFTYQLYDLGKFGDEKLMLGDYMALAVVLYLMKHIFDKDFGAILEHAMMIHSKIRDDKTSLEFLEWLFRYTFHARNENPKVLIEYVDRGIKKTGNENARRIAMTTAEKLRQEGRKQGRKEGWKEGLGEGRTALILKQMIKRFGHVSPVIEQALQNSNPETMDQFGESIFDFKNLEDAEKWWGRAQ